MLDEETYKKEIVRMWDMKRGNDYKGKDICDGVFCEDCPLSEINNDGRDGCMEPMKVFEIIKIVERWSKEHPPKKFKVSKLEFDILEIYYVRDREWHIYEILEDEFLSALFKEGYFKGATRNMTIEKYLRNCEVADDTDKR